MRSDQSHAMVCRPGMLLAAAAFGWLMQTADASGAWSLKNNAVQPNNGPLFGFRTDGSDAKGCMGLLNGASNFGLSNATNLVQDASISSLSINSYTLDLVDPGAKAVADLNGAISTSPTENLGTELPHDRMTITHAQYLGWMIRYAFSSGGALLFDGSNVQTMMPDGLTDATTLMERNFQQRTAALKARTRMLSLSLGMFLVWSMTNRDTLAA